MRWVRARVQASERNGGGRFRPRRERPGPAAGADRRGRIAYGPAHGVHADRVAEG